jgi:hypothetical protein
MSHFSNIKTQLRKIEYLTAALDDLGVTWESGGDRPIRGYQGETLSAEIAITQNNGYDIGFARNGDAYELVADLQFWEQNWSVDRFLNHVNQRYAYHTVRNEAAKQGFQVAEEVNNNDGSVRLVVQRWNG